MVALNQIRIDAETGKGSLIDLIRVAKKTTSNQASVILTKILVDNPEIRSKVVTMALNKMGRETPAADAATLFEVFSILNVAESREARAIAARTLSAALAGSPELIELVQRRALTATDAEKHFYGGGAGNLLEGISSSTFALAAAAPAAPPQQQESVAPIEEVLHMTKGRKNNLSGGTSLKVAPQVKKRKPSVRIVEEEEEEDDETQEDEEGYSTEEEEEEGGEETEYSEEDEEEEEEEEEEEVPVPRPVKVKRGAKVPEPKPVAPKAAKAKQAKKEPRALYHF